MALSWMYKAPEWFVHFDVVFELIIALISIGIAWYAFKVYSLSNQRSPRLFGVGFLLLAVSFMMLAFLNGVVLPNVSWLLEHYPIATAQNILTAAMFSHMTLFTLAWITLAYMTLKIQNVRAYWLLAALPIVALLFSAHPLYLFYIFSLLLSGYVASFYLLTYLHNKQATTFIILVGFIVIFLSKITSIASVSYTTYYIVHHSIELAAYLLLLLGFIRIVGTWPKKGKGFKSSLTS